jgi:hypothetical protein
MQVLSNCYMPTYTKLDDDGSTCTVVSPLETNLACEYFNQGSRVANILILHHLTGSLQHCYLSYGPTLQPLFHVVQLDVNLVN